jgi:hypothetical protein
MKFKVGDQVRILVGGLVCILGDTPEYPLVEKGKNGWNWYDDRPELRGKLDIVGDVDSHGNSYSLAKNGAWFGPNQLELVYRPKYKKG